MDPIPEPTLIPLPTPNHPNKEFTLNKPSPFLGDRKKIRSFLRECGLYLHVNRNLYVNDDEKIGFILSFMTGGEALQWKEQWLDSITGTNGDLTFPNYGDFIKKIVEAFTPVDVTQDAVHQIKILKQGNKTAEQLVTEFKLLVGQARYPITPNRIISISSKLSKKH